MLSSNTPEAWQDYVAYYAPQFCQFIASESVCKEKFVPYSLIGFLEAA